MAKIDIVDGVEIITEEDVVLDIEKDALEGTLMEDGEMTVDELQKSFEQISQNYTDNMSRITEAVKFREIDDSDVKKKLVAFTIEQHKIGGKKKFPEKMWSALENVPGIDKFAAKQSEASREKMIMEETVSGLVGRMYQGLRAQAADIEKNEESMMEIRNETEKTIKLMDKFTADIMKLEESQGPDRVTGKTIKMRTQVNIMAEKARDKVDTLNIVIPATRALLEAIYQVLPISEGDLLTDIAMSNGIAKINALAGDIKEMQEISDELSSSIWENMTDTLQKAITLSSPTRKDVDRVKVNMERRTQLIVNTSKMLQNQQEQVKIAAKEIDDLSRQSKEKRLALKAPTM